MMNYVRVAENDGGDGERGRQVTKPTARASSRKGCMNGKGGPLNVSCPFKGVRQRTWGKWVSEIREPNCGNRLWLGSFDSSRDAALAYDAAARKLYGPNAELNLPDEDNAPPLRPNKVVAIDAAAAKARYQRLLLEIKMKEEVERQIQMEIYIQMMLEQQSQRMIQMQIAQVDSGMFGMDGYGHYPSIEYNNTMNYHYPINHDNNSDYNETVGENNMGLEETAMILNSNLSEFDDSQMWVEATSTTDYQCQAMCDPGIAASTFDDAIGIELKHPLME